MLWHIWILDEDREENMYSHHEINISAPPLCTAWLDWPLKGGERGKKPMVSLHDISYMYLLFV